MTHEKNPSIYADRSTIGSSEELDEYGVWVKSEPQDLSSINTDTRETARSEDKGFSPEPSGDLPDFNETDTDPWLPEVSTDMADLADLNLASTDESLFNDDFAFMPDDMPAEYVAMEPLNLDAGTEEQAPELGKADALEDDSLSSIPAEDSLPEPEPEEAKEPQASPPQKAEQETGKPPELSTQLLMRIAEELSSIRNELSSLKKELQENKSPAAAASAEPEEQIEGGGFFGEEEDEKIALTGDELDNILHTANFTEEIEADTETVIHEEPFDAGFMDLSGMQTESSVETDTLPDFSEELWENGESFFAGTDTAKEDLPEVNEDFDLPPAPVEFSPELEKLRGEGAAPLAPVPEDVSFLEADPELANLTFPDLSEDNSFDSSLASLDFEDAVIEDPNLQEELKENPPEEPAPENISLELDMETQDEMAGLLDSGGEDDAFGEALEETELSDDSAGSSGFTADELSLDEDFPDTADISIDDLLSAEDDTQQAVGDLQDDDTYDQVIPEGFVIESGDSLTREEIVPNNGFPEGLDDALESEIEELPEDLPGEEEIAPNDGFSEGFEDSFSDPPALEDALELEMEELPEDLPGEEAITPNDGFPEGFEDLFSDPPALDDALELEMDELPEDLPGEEAITPNDGFSEGFEDSFSDPLALDDALELEMEELPEDLPSAELESLPEQLEAEMPDLEEEDAVAVDVDVPEPAEASRKPVQAGTPHEVNVAAIPSDIKLELRNVLSYMDQLLESLPEDKIEEFAKSEYFDTYKKLFEDLGLA
ncbi:MAG: hypothetical protein LBP81_01570 [Treponema sp.]|jgi:hypothetical protein|nr:hypothetical protein [Treponema sp.]